MVPEGWKKESLGNLFEFKNGLNTEKDQYGSGYKFVNVMDVFRNDILTESKIIGRVQVTENQLEGYQLKYGDVLFNRTSETFDEIAMAAVYLDDAIATFGGFVIRGRPTVNEVAFDYSYFLFQSQNYRNQAIKLGQGAVRANIGQKDLSKVIVLLPPLPEQRKIAKILSIWDKAIATTEKLIATSKQQKKALMQQLLTGKKRLLNPETGRVFEGEWEEVRLSGITQLLKDGTHGTHKRYKKGVPMLSATNITKEHTVSFNGAPKISEEDYEKIHAKYTIERGDILLTVVGTLGRVAIVNTDEKFTLQRSVAIIRVKKVMSNKFLKQIFSSSSFTHLLKRKSNSTAQAGVYLGELSKIQLKIPFLNEQQKIAQVLTAADQEIELLESKLAHFQQEKKSLMQQLLTGKRRVKIDNAEAV